MCDVIADEAGAATRQLSSVSLLSALDEPALSAFEAELDSLSLPGGGILFREGEAGTALYIVTAGSLGVAVRREDGHDALVARVKAIPRIGDDQWTSSCCTPTAGAQCRAPLSTGTNDCNLVLFATFAAAETTISIVSPGCCEAGQSALSSALVERVALRISESFVRCAKQESRST